MIFFDIETKPRVDLVERFTKPFPAFDPSQVKMGNIKDEAKRAEKLAQTASEHAAEEQAYWANAKDRAALNPLTGKIVAIGLSVGEKPTLMLTGDERDMLGQFWAVFTEPRNAIERFVFWSGNGSPTDNFDPDYIIRRSWILGIPVPQMAFSGNYLTNRFEDGARRYLLNKRDAYCGLSRAADELGLFTDGCGIFAKSPSDAVRGENFWQWLEGTADAAMSKDEQRALAVKYLTNDIETLKAIAGRIY